MSKPFSIKEDPPEETPQAEFSKLCWLYIGVANVVVWVGIILWIRSCVS